MTKIEVESQIGKLFKLNTKIIGCFVLLFLTFSIFNKDTEGTIFLLFFIVFFYFAIFRKFLKIKSVFFDKDFLYFENNKISLLEIAKIESNKIFYRNTFIKYNNVFSENINVLKHFIEDAKSNQKKEL